MAVTEEEHCLHPPQLGARGTEETGTQQILRPWPAHSGSENGSGRMKTPTLKRLRVRATQEEETTENPAPCVQGLDL